MPWRLWKAGLAGMKAPKLQPGASPSKSSASRLLESASRPLERRVAPIGGMHRVCRHALLRSPPPTLAFRGFRAS